MIARCLAGVLLGFPLSAALIALLYALPGGQSALIALLLLFFPLWIACMTVAYFFRSGARVVELRHGQSRRVRRVVADPSSGRSVRR